MISVGYLVGAEGFEPSTSWSRTRRSTRLSHAPNIASIPSVAPPSAVAYHRNVTGSEKLRALPAVHEVLDRLTESASRYPHALLVAEIRAAIEELRAEILAGRSN